MKKSQNILITRLRGGLGNQMFQYAMGLSVSKERNIPLKIDATGYDDINYTVSDTPRKYRLAFLNISSPLANQIEVRKNKYPLGIISKCVRFYKAKILKLRYLDYHAEIRKRNIYYIDGFWQSEKNFLNVDSILKKEFTLRQEYQSNTFLQTLTEISTSNSVSVHVRRGDYIKDKKTNSYHGTVEIDYYQKAINIISEKFFIEYIYIFTDDPEWVKINLKFNASCIYISDLYLEDYEELILMSKCKHNIIANSSFSWWGAWLNENPNKMIIAPKKWVNVEPNPHPNIIPETWITI